MIIIQYVIIIEKEALPGVQIKRANLGKKGKIIYVKKVR
jgi:hypothetical protein